MVAALRALGALCVGLGNAPRHANQRAVADAGALPPLLQLTTTNTSDQTTADDDDDDADCSTGHGGGGSGDSDEMALVRVEASLTFALVQLGMCQMGIHIDKFALCRYYKNSRMHYLYCLLSMQ